MNVFLIDFFAFLPEKIDLHMTHSYEKYVDDEDYPNSITFILNALIRFYGDPLHPGVEIRLLIGVMGHLEVQKHQW